MAEALEKSLVVLNLHQAWHTGGHGEASQSPGQEGASGAWPPSPEPGCVLPLSLTQHEGTVCGFSLSWKQLAALGGRARCKSHQDALTPVPAIHSLPRRPRRGAGFHLLPVSPRPAPCPAVSLPGQGLARASWGPRQSPRLRLVGPGPKLCFCQLLNNIRNHIEE